MTNKTKGKRAPAKPGTRGRKRAKDVISFAGIELYSLGYITETFGIGKTSLRGYIKSGRLKATKIAGRWFFQMEDIVNCFLPEKNKKETGGDE